MKEKRATRPQSSRGHLLNPFPIPVDLSREGAGAAFGLGRVEGLESADSAILEIKESQVKDPEI